MIPCPRTLQFAQEGTVRAHRNLVHRVRPPGDVGGRRSERRGRNTNRTVPPLREDCFAFVKPVCHFKESEDAVLKDASVGEETVMHGNDAPRCDERRGVFRRAQR
jgi:hypothetical protein